MLSVVDIILLILQEAKSPDGSLLLAKNDVALFTHAFIVTQRLSVGEFFSTGCHGAGQQCAPGHDTHTTNADVKTATTNAFQER